jgi:molecular chaperone GrpE
MPKKATPKLTIAQLGEQNALLTEALQRERADAINVRRRLEQERAQMGNIYKSEVVREFLPIIDNLERALKHVPKELEDHDYMRGIASIVKQLDKALASLGIEKIPTTGQLFNPHYHEAAAMEDGDGSHEVVSEELQAGYKLGDEVIRHATVKVKMQDMHHEDSKEE